MTISRRSMMAGAAAGLGMTTVLSGAGKAVKNGRLKQSFCKWCYKGFTLEQLCDEANALGVPAIDLLVAEEWPAAGQRGIVCSMGSGSSPLTDGMNDKNNHSRIEDNLRKLLPLAAGNKVPSLICFSGNRRGISDEQGWDNCALILNKVKAQAEDLNVNIVMELLNSKVNHADYQCDRTAWGVELCKRVNSPRFGLLYDIYHMQIMEGDVIRTLRDNIQYIRHFHTGGNPGRNEIDDTQELNYQAIARAIVETGYQGYCAHEFVPKRDPLTSLREAVELCDV